MKSNLKKITIFILSSSLLVSAGCSARKSAMTNKNTSKNVQVKNTNFGQDSLSNESDKASSTNVESSSNDGSKPYEAASAVPATETAKQTADNTTKKSTVPNSTHTPPPAPKPTGPVPLQKDGTIEELISYSDPANAARNINNFNNLQKKYIIPDEYKLEIKKALRDGYKAEDIYVAYEILHLRYGFINELNMLLKNHYNKGGWRGIYRDYLSTIPIFTPHNFTNGYYSLDDLAKYPRIDAMRDCTIADLVGNRTGLKFDDLIGLRISGKPWTEINLNLHIVSLGDTSMYGGGIDGAEVISYLADGKLTKNQVIDAFIVSYMYKLDRDTVINQMKNGLTRDDITVDYFVSLYAK